MIHLLKNVYSQYPHLLPVNLALTNKLYWHIWIAHNEGQQNHYEYELALRLARTITISLKGASRRKTNILHRPVWDIITDLYLEANDYGNISYQIKCPYTGEILYSVKYDRRMKILPLTFTKYDPYNDICTFVYINKKHLNESFFADLATSLISRCDCMEVILQIKSDIIYICNDYGRLGMTKNKKNITNTLSASNVMKVVAKYVISTRLNIIPFLQSAELYPLIITDK